MEVVVIVPILALLQYYWFAIEVSRMRAKHGCPAPAMTGHPKFERMNRVHYNSLEQLIMFLPAQWLYGYYARFIWAAGFGIVYLVGRFVYRYAYVRDPSSHSPGFTFSVLPTTIMLIWVLVVAAGRCLV